MKENEKPEKSPASKNKKKKGRFKTINVVLTVTVVIVCIATIAVSPILFKGAPKEATIRIPRNATQETVIDSVTKYFGKDYALHVNRLLDIREIDFGKRHGAYHIEKGTTPMFAVKALTRNAQTPVRLTVNGFRGLPQLAVAIAKKMDFTAEEFLEVLRDPDFMATYGLTPEQALSLFLDDTYEVYWSQSPKEVITKIGKNYLKFWDLRNNTKLKNLGLSSAAEAMTIASIVDEETNKESEKGRIGRLYTNRLQKGMRLQADPTVKYALQDFSIKRITEAMTHHKSPYNTYVNPGLPPGPIRSTSVNTLKKILNSAPSQDLYMCAKEDFSGYHNFATNYEDHLANARRYQEALDRLNIQ